MDKILDIHIIYCDKDKEYLAALLAQCKNFRIENSLSNWKIFVYAHDNSGENNIGQFQRRLEIIRNTPESHYVWFIDGDDEIIGNADLVEGDFDDVDIIGFAHQMNVFSEIDGYNIFIETRSYEENIVIDTQKYKTLKRGESVISIMDLAGGSLWTKWIKASCWNGVFDYLKKLGYENIKPNASEDVFFAMYAVKNSHNLLYCVKPVYYYHNERSHIFNDEKFIPYENFERFRVNHKEITDAIKKLDMGKSTSDFIMADYLCHLQKALSCLDIKKAIDNLIEEFGKENVIRAIILGRFYIRHPYVKYLAYKYLQNSN